MVRKFLLASVGALAVTTGSAFAADLPSRAPPPVYLPPAPIFTWTGIYIGGQIGYAWASGSNDVNGFDPFTSVGFVSNAGGTPSGVIGGGNVGYNYQINQWVLGLEGSVDGTSLSNTTLSTVPIYGGISTVSRHTTADIQGSIRGRLGIAWDRALIYATGGVAFGGFSTDRTIYGTDFFGNPVFGDAGSRSTTRVGWTVGGGLQYAVTNNWSVRAEYRYTDWGTLNENGAFNDAAFVLAPTAAFIANRKLQQNQVQVGFDYKFDLFTPPPVVAKY